MSKPRLPDAVCIKCEITFHQRHFGQKYCSGKCWHGRGSSLGIDVTHPITECGFCKKTFRTNKASFEKFAIHFCSRDCFKKYKTANMTEELGRRGRARYILFEERGKKCEKCGYDKYENIIIVHHKKGAGTPNTRENTILLCPTCHAEAHLALLEPSLNENGKPRGIRIPIEPSTRQLVLAQ